MLDPTKNQYVVYIIKRQTDAFENYFNEGHCLVELLFIWTICIFCIPFRICRIHPLHHFLLFVTLLRRLFELSIVLYLIMFYFLFLARNRRTSSRVCWSYNWRSNEWIASPTISINSKYNKYWYNELIFSLLLLFLPRTLWWTL